MSSPNPRPQVFLKHKSLHKTGVKEKLVVKAPVIEKPLAEESIELKIPVNKNICVVPMAHIDPKPKIEKIVEVPDKVRRSAWLSAIGIFCDFWRK